MALDTTWWNTDYEFTELVPDFSLASVTNGDNGNYRLETIDDIVGPFYMEGGNYQGTGNVLHGDDIYGYAYGYGGGNYAAWESVYCDGQATPYSPGSFVASASGRKLFFPCPLRDTVSLNRLFFYWSGVFVTPRNVHLWIPNAWMGTVAEVIGAILRTLGVAVDMIDTAGFAAAHEDQQKYGSGEDNPLYVVYRREPGQQYGETIMGIARHSWDLLTITMAGKISMVPRKNPGAYTVGSLENVADGVVAVQWSVTLEHIGNYVIAGYGRWRSGWLKTPAAGVNYIEDQEHVAVPSGWGSDSDALWQTFEDAASVAKYGRLQIMNSKARFYANNVAETLSVFHLPYLTSNSLVSPNPSRYEVCEQLVRDYFARLDVDSLSRKEIRVVQDMRGIDYDCGWRVADVAVTHDGQTIADTRCVSKLINFDDMTVTSVLLEEPAPAE
jgi:hypothetical protein